MAKRAEDVTPGMGTRAKLSDGPALLLRILQGFMNMSVRMVGHCLVCFCRGVFFWYSNHTMTSESSEARKPTSETSGS